MGRRDANRGHAKTKETEARMGSGISKEVFILVLFEDDFAAKNRGRSGFQNGKKNALIRSGDIR